MSASTLSRDARHLGLPQIGAEGQRRIAGGTALLIGVGGIGCASAMYLASSSIGRFMLCDFDTVDETNLGRQILYGPGDTGELKSEVAASRLRKVNPIVDVVSIPERLTGAALVDAVVQADVVLDGSDNFTTPFQVNDACVVSARRLIIGAAIRLEGQLAVFGPDYSVSPCYRCLYIEADESLENCAGNGVLAPVPGVVGTIMAAEALKYLAGIDTAAPVLRLYDAAATEFRHLAIHKRSDCPACAENR